ncbi:MAG: hypothetical protein OK455_01225 [Thaumarchaeota archaeon]|nr:hypothetical protein [Nitrososphaerota archaeon]
MARSTRGLPRPVGGDESLASSGSSLGLIANGSAPRREGVRGRLDMSVRMILSSPPSTTEMRLLGPVAAAAVSEAIRKDTGVISWLHWPNLVSIDGRIVGKTSMSSFPLPAVRGEKGQKRAVVIELSVNCFCALSRRPSSKEPPPTSLLNVLGVEVDIALLRERILESITWYCAEWERGVYGKLVQRMEPTISWMGRDVVVKTTSGVLLKGRASALAKDGSLLLVQEKPKGKATLKVSPEVVDLVVEPPLTKSTPRKNTLL